MARMIPSVEERERFNGSYGEEILFPLLQKLPPEYIVFHSVKWTKKNQNRYRQWGECDYVIYCPSRGILTVEVKSGGISCETPGVIMQINTLTHEQKLIHPMAQADSSKYAFLEMFKANNCPSPHIEPIVWFTSVDKAGLVGHLPHGYMDGNVLFQNDLADPLKAIENCFEFYSMNPHRYEQEQVDAVVDVLAPAFDAVASVSSIYGEQESCFNRMTDEQSYLLDYLEEQKTAVIQGAAGTGKTMLALEKARRLSKHENVLFLCYNKMLLSYFKTYYKDSMPNVYFYNLQSMASKALNLEASNDDVSEFLLYYNQYFDHWKFTSIIIDEGQDFNEEHMNFLKEIAANRNGSFYVFYDKNQLVQQPGSNLGWLKDVECRLVLNMNCRNTRSIATTSGAPLSITDIKMRQDVVGVKPCFYISSTQEGAIQKIADLLDGYKDNHFTNKQVVILTVKTVEQSILSGLTRIGSHKITCDENGRGILFTTARKFKGLEADAIIVVDVKNRTLSTDEQKRLFYVGTSRAKHFLDFVSVMTDKEKAEFETELSGDNKRRAMLIQRTLKVNVKNMN